MLLGEHRPACDGRSRLVAKRTQCAIVFFERLLRLRVGGLCGVGKDRPNSDTQELKVALKAGGGV